MVGSTVIRKENQFITSSFVALLAHGKLDSTANRTGGRNQLTSRDLFAELDSVKLPLFVMACIEWPVDDCWFTWLLLLALLLLLLPPPLLPAPPWMPPSNAFCSNDMVFLRPRFVVPGTFGPTIDEVYFIISVSGGNLTPSKDDVSLELDQF